MLKYIFSRAQFSHHLSARQRMFIIYFIFWRNFLLFLTKRIVFSFRKQAPQQSTLVY